MKNKLKKLFSNAIVLALTLSFALVGGACGDGKKEQSYDPETRPVTFAISALDGTFNPFFTTSATDQSVAGLTQVGMLSTSNDGDIECGEDVPTVVLDYKITSYDKSGAGVTGSTADHTTYDFVIKNGIKFSDGVDLTIDDVLFNLYVYLDPMYSGSSTIYSVNIQGLKKYRYNDPTMQDGSTSDIEKTFRVEAQQRIDDLISWSDNEKNMDEEMEKDLEKVRAQFKKDLLSDWNANVGQLESSYTEYSFTEDWQSFYLNEGIINIVTEQNTSGNTVIKRDNNKKYVTDLNNTADFSYNSDLQTDILSAASDETKIAKYMSDYSCDRELAIDYIKRDFAIDVAYNAYASDKAIKNGIVTILQGMTTGSTVLENWTLEEQSDYYKGQSSSVKSIDGIKTYKTSSFDGVNKTKLTEEHDVLSITINGIDPKAIWNFAFTVAPMHYYSNEETIANKEDYPYGVKARDKEFFDEVLNSPEKNLLPVGAGAYRASNEAGNASNDPSKINIYGFWSNKKCYYERNDYFETLGSGICNAKIRRFIYEEVTENNILTRLKTGEIDYGMPSAKPENKASAIAESHLAVREYMTNGYGYVGINPKYVKDLEVRQAIMLAFDTSTVIDGYYGGTMAEPIYRPMTTLSWAYPSDCKPYYQYDSTKYDSVGDQICALVEKAGYKKNGNGIYEKNGTTLKFKFTIAGDTTDHPAASMFEKARQILNQNGFDITVGTDVSALKKLSTGNLEVWAAAWTSTIDPDMYQIYHKDSKTTNTKNWNYDGIMNTDEYPREQEIVIELSKLIDQGRSTNNKNERIKIYADALDKIMELAIEFPTYNRKDLAVYNKDVLDASTMNQTQNLKYHSPTERLWELNYN